MKRATLLLDDAIYDRAKALGRERGKTLKDILNELLRFALNGMATAKNKKIELPLHQNSGPAAGVNVANRNNLYSK